MILNEATTLVFRSSLLILHRQKSCSLHTLTKVFDRGKYLTYSTASRCTVNLQ